MSYSFQPKLLLSSVCLALCLIFTSLGVWQLERSTEKQKIYSELNLLAKEPARSLNEGLEQLTPATKAVSRGHYLAKDLFLLDNIVYQGKPGYYVLTPFAIDGSDDIILINRGWVAKQRGSLPEIATALEQIVIKGTLAPPRSKPVILGNIEQPISVLPLVLRLNPEPDSEFVRDWPKYEAKSGMHIGYAIQWFVFALFVLIALLGINFKKKPEFLE